jgi:predicted nucleic acid-binding protein
VWTSGRGAFGDRRGRTSAWNLAGERSGTADQTDRVIERLLTAVPVEPLTLRTARIAAKIDGEAKNRGVTIPFADLLIGSTAIDLGYAVITTNLRHFRMIPGLNVIDL